MNKSDLVSAIADNSGLSKADAARALEATTSAISGALASGNSVAISGFGSFLVRARAARTGRMASTLKRSLEFSMVICLRIKH